MPLNESGVGNIGDFRPISRHISEMVQGRNEVAIGQYNRKSQYALSIITDKRQKVKVGYLL